MKAADILFVGAGLANTLLAYRLKQKFPDRKILFVDSAAGPRADRTWSFHESDLAPAVWAWLSPLADPVWDGYDVEFPSFRRELRASRYASLRGENLLARAGMAPFVRWDSPVERVEPGSVTLVGGEKLVAGAVVDGRGFPAGPGGGPAVRVGYQKFLGQNLLLSRPHGLARPVVMDATVAQKDGYRFIYLLPWSERRLLVEDTYYSGDPSINKDHLRQSIADYVSAKGWWVEELEGEECSALPIPLFAEKQPPAPLTVGTAGGLFHPVTGYSLPYAAAVAESWDPLAADAGVQLWRLRSNLSRRHSFYRALNRMLFLAAEPSGRRQIFEKFYRLPEPLVQRFYAGRSHLVDGARILSGRPPVPVAPALRAMMQTQAAMQKEAAP